jgi:EAL domain-containing protein (putative c-di-GMP-specific phosphodiesterase class I)
MNSSPPEAPDTAATPPPRPAKPRLGFAAMGPTLIRQIFALIVIWGLVGFGWGSLNAWGRYQLRQQLAAVVDATAPTMANWLKNNSPDAHQVATNPAVRESLQTPLGLASPAVERAFTAQTMKLSNPDLMLFDTQTGRTLSLPGSTPPAPDVLKRLADLPSAGSKLVADGQQIGMLYLAARVPLPKDKQIYVINSQGLRQLAKLWGEIAVTDTMNLTLALPHAAGQAVWSQQEPLRLSPSYVLPALYSSAAFTNYPEVTLSAAWVTALPPMAMLPKKILLVLGLLASLMVLWPYTAPLREAIWLRLTPRLQPSLQRLETKGWWKSADVSHAWSAHKLLNQVEKFIPLGGLVQSLNSTAKAASLVDELGTYSARDFKTLPEPHLSTSSTPKIVKPATPDTPPVPASQPGAEVDPEILKERVQRCIRQGLVELMYQPMYRNQDNTVEANEVLARLADVSGVIAPGQFLPILTKMEQVSALDALVFEKVMEHHFTNGRGPAVTLSLNISGTSLEDLGYLRDVAKQGPTVLKHLMFEVRSNEVVRDPNALQLLKALQRQGARVAVDYFGGGKAMVSASKALGIDCIKMDMMRFTSSPALKQEFEEVCHYATSIGLAVVVEKIEDQAMEAFARQAGAKLLQGYGLGKPGNNLVTLPLQAKLG